MFQVRLLKYTYYQLIIMTGQVDKYKNLEISGQIEFTKESPTELTPCFNSNGHQQVLVVADRILRLPF
jgi:hypothetical protein